MKFEKYGKKLILFVTRDFDEDKYYGNDIFTRFMFAGHDYSKILRMSNKYPRNYKRIQLLERNVINKMENSASFGFEQKVNLLIGLIDEEDGKKYVESNY